MDNQLLTLSKIFTERLFRIPDYQRGYAWTSKQLKDFWNDLEQLGASGNHYTGVLTLEDVPHETYTKWDDDFWIISAKSYQPFFVVDGQQRLTTSIILIQCILERVPEGGQLNFTNRADIQRKFIFDSKDNGISRSYAFGYERDNPSYEFLKTKIFCERSSSSSEEETIYTQNLASAKQFFTEKLANLNQENLESLYRKVTQQLLFNIFTITEDVDVCVAFETMNNRGKPLSYLELLKNRLIYLSLKFEAPEYERKKLRSTINDCWKAIYHNLGRNKEQPLEDDRFLLTHYVIYFGQNIIKEFNDDELIDYKYSRLYHANYADDLLEKRFVTRNVLPDASQDNKISLQDIYKYVNSLQEAVETWYKMWNPDDSDFSEDEKIWLDKINRLVDGEIKPLILVFLQTVPASQKRLDFLQAIERQVFLTSLFNDRYGYRFLEGISPNALKLAIKMRAGEITAEKLTKQINETTNNWIKNDVFKRDIFGRLKAEGYYNWRGIRYFLFEYNLDLQKNSKTDRAKIFWPEFVEQRKDFISVEHIYPRQARHIYWTSRFGKFNQKQKTALRDSLGNLLPLSKPKNSSLSNKPFTDKIENKSGNPVSYRFGCYAENEVSIEQEWGPEQILKRGIKMLNFLQRRWGVDLGDDKAKKALLGLEFIN